MNGQELFKLYTSKRNFSGDEHDRYAELLMSIFDHVGNDILPMLIEADKIGKRLGLKEASSSLGRDEIIKDDVIFV